MDTREIQKLKLKLRDDITRLILDFQEQTGCVANVTVDQIPIQQLDGVVNGFPSVTVDVWL